MTELQVFDNSEDGDPQAEIAPQPRLLLHMKSGRIQDLSEGAPLSMRLLNETHRRLMRGVRGAEKPAPSLLLYPNRGDDDQDDSNVPDAGQQRERETVSSEAGTPGAADDTTYPDTPPVDVGRTADTPGVSLVERKVAGRPGYAFGSSSARRMEIGRLCQRVGANASRRVRLIVSSHSNARWPLGRSSNAPSAGAASRSRGKRPAHPG